MGVLPADVGVSDAVERRADALQPGQREVTRVAAAFADVVAGLNKHAG